VQELKPYIDQKYSVYTNRKNTFIAGSSLGALISMYAICEYPKIFGGAACLSTHWVGTLSVNENPIPNAFIAYLDKNLPSPKNHEIYFDCGDKTLDAMYPPIQKRVDSLMLAKGYDGTNWLTRYFPGDDHSEKSWSKRLNIPLEFLFRTADSLSAGKQ
jgi:enterochelin esterase-like enzyme